MSTEETEDIEQIKKKDVAYYSAGVAAWYNTSLEHDKSLFTLSAGGIGLLMTLIRTVGITSVETLVLYILAIVGFLVCLVAILVIFKKNRTHIEQVFQGRQEVDHSLAVFDNIAIWSFGIAVLFSAVIGISSAISSYTTKGVHMANENNKQLSSGGKITFDSVNGISSLAPQNILKESFNGVGGLQQKPVINQTAQPQGATASQAPIANSQEPIKK